MTARLIWIAWLLIAFAIVPAIFRIRFGRWPFAYAIVPKDAYSWIDLAFAGAIAMYTWRLILGPDPQPISIPGGIAVVALGETLQLWAIVAMGANWRIGQSDDDPTINHIESEPFRTLRHPIYFSMITLAIGMALLTGFHGNAVFLLLAACLYFGIQGRAESLYWNSRGEHADNDAFTG